MSKSERRENLLAVGIIAFLLGVLAIHSGITQPVSLDTVGTKLLEIIGGSFVAVLGLYACAWGVSDEAGKDASRFLKAVFDRFLRALGK